MILCDIEGGSGVLYVLNDTGWGEGVHYVGEHSTENE